MKSVRILRHAYVALAIAFPTTACGAIQATPASASTQISSSTESGAVRPIPVRIVYRVPGNNQDPAWSLTGARGNGVWSWDVGSRSSINYVSGVNDRERVYWLPRNCCGGGDRAFPGLAVAPNGTVWGVLNHSLIELNPTTGRLSISSLPSAAATSGEPPTDLDLSENSADLVAISPDGKELIVGFEYAAAVALYGLRGNAVRPRPSMIPLPPGYMALDIAVLADGTIGIGLERFGPRSDSEIYLLRRDGSTIRVPVPNGWGVAADGDGFLVGDLSPVFVSESGRIGPVPASFTLPQGDTWAANAGDSGPDPLSVMPGGLIVRPIDRGKLEVASRVRDALFAMPRQRYPNAALSCGGCGLGSTTTTLVPPPEWVWQRDPVAQTAVDGEGDIWVLTQTPAFTIAFAEIPSAQLHAAFR
jgi:hypothetical protein